jgi:glycosyltransferase involved in cell wall biosynthesis
MTASLAALKRTSSTPRASIHQFLASSELGGAEQVALRLAKDCEGSGRSQCLWAPRSDRRSPQLALASEYDAGALLGKGLLSAAKAQYALARQLRKQQCVLAHVHAPFLYGALRWSLKLAGCSSLVHIHSRWDEPGLRWALKHPPDAIVVCARYLEDEVRACLPARARESVPIVTIPNAVDTDAFFPGDKNQAKAKVGARIDRPLALMLANLSPLKGQATAIEATAILKRRGIDIDCWLAGVERGDSTAYTRQLEGHIDSAGVSDRVRLLGQRSDTADLLRAADILWLPSQTEGLPLSILEAQASGTPVIASPVGGIPEVIADGVTGYLVPPEEAGGYTARTAELLASVPRRTQIATAGREQALREQPCANMRGPSSANG